MMPVSMLFCIHSAHGNLPQCIIPQEQNPVQCVLVAVTADEATVFMEDLVEERVEAEAEAKQPQSMGRSV